MQTHTIVYGPRPSGEGFGVVSESGDLDQKDRSQLIAFCKAIRWSPHKREAPDLSCIALVPTPNIFWLCRIDETTDDKERLLAIRVTATGYDRSDSEAVQRFRAELSVAGVEPDNIPELRNLVKSVILTHSELLHFESQPGEVARPEQPPPEVVSPPLTNPPKDPAAPRKSRGQPMKSMLMLLLGAIVAAFSVWGGYVRPARENADRLKAENVALQAKYRDVESNMQKWRDASQKQYPGITSPELLSERIQATKQEIGDAQKKIEELKNGLDPDDRKIFDVVSNSKTLPPALDAASDAIKNLQKALTKENKLDKATGLVRDAWSKVSPQESGSQ